MSILRRKKLVGLTEGEKCEQKQRSLVSRDKRNRISLDFIIFRWNGLRFVLFLPF
jgi:hypothetical protein